MLILLHVCYSQCLLLHTVLSNTPINHHTPNHERTPHVLVVIMSSFRKFTNDKVPQLLWSSCSYVKTTTSSNHFLVHVPYTLCKNFTAAPIPLTNLQHQWPIFTGKFLLGYEHVLEFPYKIASKPHQNTPHELPLHSVFTICRKKKCCSYFITYLRFSPEVLLITFLPPKTA